MSEEVTMIQNCDFCLGTGYVGLPPGGVPKNPKPYICPECEGKAVVFVRV